MAHGGNRNHNVNSTETILTFDNRDQMSDWSVVWSTSHVPGMDTATGGGGGARRRVVGRRRLRIGALALGSLLTMHLRVTASSLTGGYFVYILLLIPAMALLANPMRHFEVYLGQWSISGPGRAFRIIPMFDGIGLAIAIGSLIRAIVNCVIAAMAAVYIIHALSDDALPYTTCRDFDLETYEPDLKEEPNQSLVFFRTSGASMRKDVYAPYYLQNYKPTYLPPLNPWKKLMNLSQTDTEKPSRRSLSDATLSSRQIQVCKDPYQGTSYPPYCKTAAYNFFYVEVAKYRTEAKFKGFNVTLAVMIALNWTVIWCCMISERIMHGRLIWNNLPLWFIWVPWVWTLGVIASGVQGFISKHKDLLRPKFRLSSGTLLQALADALETAIYVHAASTGTELVHGKGLNHYASGHIDPDLNAENVWHSGILMVFTALTTGGGAICAITDYSQTNIILNKTVGSTTWILPMYSRCATFGTHTHIKSIAIFSGLTFSYVSVSYVLVKTALHTIFEYRVKLVFIEQFIVGALVLVCAGLSMVFTTNGGLPLLESVDSLMSGIVMPFICALELLGIMYIYHGHDFVSDMNLSMEENACSSRMEIQWQLLPFIILVLLGLRISTLVKFALPTEYVWLGVVPVAAVVIAVPIRACHNAYVFLRPSPRHGT